MSHAAYRMPDETVLPRLHAYDREMRARRNSTILGFVTLALCVVVSAYVAEVDMTKLWANIHQFTNYLGRIFYLENGQHVVTDVAEWFWGLGKWTFRIIDTLLIAYLGTLFGAVGAFFMCFAAAENLAKSPTRRFLARRVLEFCRTVPELVFALIFVVAFGLGPVPGVIAIAIHTFGALGKLFAEVVENVDMKPVEGATASGATRWQSIRFAVVPQVLSNFASYGLLRFEINVRGASVMGFVGAGGIGQDLLEAVRKFYYSDVSAILILIIVTVMLIDVGTERLRNTLLAKERGK